jgi:hypothetical protein
LNFALLTDDVCTLGTRQMRLVRAKDTTKEVRAILEQGKEIR